MNSQTVVGRPRLFLQLDGLILFVGSLILFGRTHQHWWWVPLLLFAPDIFMVGYARSTKVGALIYNIGHSYLLPAITTFYGWRSNHLLTLGIGLIWLSHIGMDRVAGYGLKYDDNFQHTHLGNLFKK